MARINDYETVLIFALHFAIMNAIGVETIADYVGKELPKLSDECIEIIQDDIEKAELIMPCTFGLCESDWKCLLEQIEEEMEKRYGRT